MKVKEESEKVGLKLNFQKMKIMAFGPITSWEIDGETVETVSGFIFWGSEITADGDCSHEIKRCLLLGRKVMTNLDSIFKSRAHPEPSSLLPPHTISLGCPSAPAPSIQYRALNLDWQLVSYMILHMFVWIFSN